jgi:hypothetical protein
LIALSDLRRASCRRYFHGVWRCHSVLAGFAALVLAGCAGTLDPRPEARPNLPASAPPAGARPARGDTSRDAFVLLSGGGTPATNNYSQYLQAQAIAGFFARECPPERSWVFFGAEIGRTRRRSWAMCAAN